MQHRGGARQQRPILAVPDSNPMNALRLIMCGNGSAMRAIIVALASIGSLAAGACRKEPPKAEARPPAEVTVMKAEPRDLPITFEYVGRTLSSHQVDIRARVSGFLEHRTYEEGSIVDENKVLFEMDKKPFIAQVNAAAAALERNKAAHETARLNLERTKPLVAQNALSQKDLDDSQGFFDTTAALVEQSKAQLETANLDLSYCTIMSPLKGITSDAKQKDGAYVNPLNSLLTTVAALDPMWVEFSISENELSRYRGQAAQGQIKTPSDLNFEIEVILLDGSVFPHVGRITYVTPSFSELTGTFNFRATVDNPKLDLRPNQYVHVRLKGATRPNAMLVPQRAVRQDAKGSLLFLVNKEGKAEIRPVTLGDWIGENIVITSGLKAGDQVIVDGGLIVRPGDVVTVKGTAAASQSSGDKAGDK